MSLARAFTRRNRRGTDAQTPNRGTSVKYTPGTIDRKLISLPTELISTTNVQVFTAPDIPRHLTLSSGSSVSSGMDSDLSTIDRSFLSHAGSDTSSVDSSPATPITPPMEDLKAFFDRKFDQAATLSLAEPIELVIPDVPKRAPSHSKRAHVELSRQRSFQQSSPPRNNLKANSVRVVDYATTNTNQDHPFGRELAQVHEVAEGFGASAALFDEEERDMLNRGLFKFDVQDYLDEISGLSGGVFDDRLGPLSRPWI